MIHRTPKRTETRTCLHCGNGRVQRTTAPGSLPLHGDCERQIRTTRGIAERIVGLLNTPRDEFRIVARVDLDFVMACPGLQRLLLYLWLTQPEITTPPAIIRPFVLPGSETQYVLNGTESNACSA